MILLIDNYDSFAHNLARYLTRLGGEIVIVRNDAVTVADVQRMGPSAIVLSPGPCTPSEAGCLLDVVAAFADRRPMLGVCLGHQAIVAALGGHIVRSDPVHGRTSQIQHNGRGVFQGVPNPFEGCRYHSLVAERASLPRQLEITGVTLSGDIMAVQHRWLPLVGVQFHPEAILSQFGYLILANFMRVAGIPVAKSIPSIEDELRCRSTPTTQLPKFPVTF